MTPVSTTIPYLYLEEGVSLDTLRELLLTYELEVVPQERYYYQYKDAIRIIDFVQTKGIYDGWVLEMKEEDCPKADQMLAAHSDKFCLFVPIERQFLEGLSSPLLQQTLGSQHATGRRLDLILVVLKERGITITTEEIISAKAALKVKNEKRQPKVLYAKVIVWAMLAGITLGYLWLIGFLG